MCKFITHLLQICRESSALLGYSEFDMHEKRHLLIESIQSVYRPEDIEIVAEQLVLIAINDNISY